MRPFIVLILGIFGIAGLVWALLSGIEPRPPTPDRLVYFNHSFSETPGWREDNHLEAVEPLKRSCEKLLKRPDEELFYRSRPDLGAVSDWAAPCKALIATELQSPETARLFFEKWYRPVKITNNGAELGLFTGYFEAELNGSLTKSARYIVPLLRRPTDLVMVQLGAFHRDLRGRRIAGRVADGRLVPYENRAQIETGALFHAGQREEELAIVWVDSEIDAFFLQIQGSGRIKLADGGVLRVGYAGQNGHPYTAIGRPLIQMGEIAVEDMSMAAIRDWLEGHPAQASGLMQQNASYVFFAENANNDGDLGPLGAGGLALTPGRSLAVDRKFHPLDAPMWLDTVIREGKPDQSRWRKLMVAQDTGGAIRGPVRGDIFFGFGETAVENAGGQRAQGALTLLAPRSLPPQWP